MGGRYGGGCINNLNGCLQKISKGGRTLFKNIVIKLLERLGCLINDRFDDLEMF